jgi:hypothetical protein
MKASLRNRRGEERLLDGRKKNNNNNNGGGTNRYKKGWRRIGVINVIGVAISFEANRPIRETYHSHAHRPTRTPDERPYWRPVPAYHHQGLSIPTPVLR